ncbi:MAG: hypothetical protein GC156_10650 [Actinomycetales bacterium]|nr:hypothetical protein [Actinomycetales bacterium]
MVRWGVLVLVDVLVVVGLSVGFGAWAPRWPDAWLGRDVFPLTRMPWETVHRYRRWGAARLTRRLPERGELFGGQSKSQLPGTANDQLERYLLEVRRAEWVHWLSIASTLVLLPFNPLWLASTFIGAVALGNLPFIMVLRNNRFRLQRILDRSPTT